MPGRPRRLRARAGAALAGDAGMVTVEAAFAIAAIAAVLCLVAGGVGAALTQIRLVDAAREAARVAAISGADEGRRAGRSAAPGGASVVLDIRREGEAPVAVAELRAATPLPGLAVTARAVARLEPGTDPLP